MTPAKPPTRRRGVRLWRALALTVSLPLVAGALIWGASVVGDRSRGPAALAEAAQGSGVMYCTEGALVRGDGSFFARLVDSARLRCTAWKMRGQQTDSVKGVVTWPTSPWR